MTSMRTVLIVLIVWFGAMLSAPTYGQSAENAKGDLAGENRGDQIWLWWGPVSGAEEYVVYRSYSISGPWEILYAVPKELTSGVGPKVDVTSEAMVRDLCYQIDAKNSSGVVIYVFQPICVPKYVP